MSITEGVAFGVLSYALLKLAAGRGREVHPLLYAFAALFLGRYVVPPVTGAIIESASSECPMRGRCRSQEQIHMDVQIYKDALLRKRVEILGTGGIKPLQASMENNTRQGDMADQASGNNEVHIQLKLKQTDAKILQAIEEALWRIEKGTYGVCRDCGEPIAEARLNAIPWTRVCITCKEKQGS